MDHWREDIARITHLIQTNPLKLWLGDPSEYEREAKVEPGSCVRS